MTCPYCDKRNAFMAKLGRCQRCMKQLAVLAVMSWGIWGIFFIDTPKNVNAIALLMAAIGFSGLLILHLIVKLFIQLNASNKKKPNSR